VAPARQKSFSGRAEPRRGACRKPTRCQWRQRLVRGHCQHVPSRSGSRHSRGHLGGTAGMLYSELAAEAGAVELGFGSNSSGNAPCPGAVKPGDFRCYLLRGEAGESARRFAGWAKRHRADTSWLTFRFCTEQGSARLQPSSVPMCKSTAARWGEGEGARGNGHHARRRVQPVGEGGHRPAVEDYASLGTR